MIYNIIAFVINLYNCSLNKWQDDDIFDAKLIYICIM